MVMVEGKTACLKGQAHSMFQLPSYLAHSIGSKWIMTNIDINGTEEYPPHLYVRGIENVKRTCIFAE